MIRSLFASVVSVAAVLTTGAAPSGQAPRPFPAGAAVDYQLGGSYAVPTGVGIVSRDSTSRPAAGVWSICYVNGFQTQPDQHRRWQGRNASLVLHRHGKRVQDPGWPGEYLLDTRTAAKRARIARELGKDLARCARRGFDAVEIDNLDSYTRSHHLLTLTDAIALARLYARQAHRAGLLIAQKNDAEHSARLQRPVGFDFAVAEECVAYHECADYTKVYGSRVVDVEYTDDPGITLRTVCSSPGHPVSLVLRDRDLLTQGHRGYVDQRCSDLDPSRSGTNR